ncbi:MAG: hypothetical protein ACI31R_05555 [Bacilli bacterium]
MDKEQENQFKENIKEIARLELKNSFNNNLMETLNSAFIFKYVDTLEKQSQKYKEVIDKAIEYIEIHKRKDEFLELNEWGTRNLLEILKEVE